MTWIPLAERFAALPLILVGPILRRVEPRSVTVWLALKEARAVTLRVYGRGGQGRRELRFEGARATVRLGDHVHLVAVTAYANDNTALEWGELYWYDLFFQSTASNAQETTNAVPLVEGVHLETPGVLTREPASADPLQRLVYPGHRLPSFVLPARDLSQVRLVHGSCRKPHGTGQEMLSSVDTLIEMSSQLGKERPQQLFLTGDQIYADDVAASLLFMLIDAGTFLFAGNEQEILPLVNASSRELAPQGRGDAVRTKAMFTTTTPENHLLALAEYAAMYLFAWSDVLWPETLPGLEDLWSAYPEARPEPGELQQRQEAYDASLEKLSNFRATLPQVRRALASIATYMICDDHEVTDDWFLDGGWCQRVLASALGRRIVRNALLAYALFQGWGNTPEQFAVGSEHEGRNGALFLKTIDAWRGDESGREAELLEDFVGLPPGFAGSGELQRTPHALRWHYRYDAPTYQVIVMNTRTHRLYCSPGDFPGLLSATAMHAQIAAVAREDVEVTIIVSATPVVGVDFIEAVQFWTRFELRENYAYDCEAWGLERSTFEHFLRLVSTLKQVVFLAGDVHYAFGSSLDYWDYNTRATAKIVNFTSSPFKNEGSGSHIAVLAIGYPRLQRLLTRQGRATISFCAWDLTAHNQPLLNHLRRALFTRAYRFWWFIPSMVALERSPNELVLSTRNWPHGSFDSIPPDRVYRVNYLRNTLARQIVPIVGASEGVGKGKGARKGTPLRDGALRVYRLALEGVTFLQTSLIAASRRLESRVTVPVEEGQLLPRARQTLANEALQGTALLERRLERRRTSLVRSILHHNEWLSKWKAGELVIGYNNLGEIRFDWSEGRKEVTQRLWWYRPSDDGEEPELTATDYSETLMLPEPDARPLLP